MQREQRQLQLQMQMQMQQESLKAGPAPTPSPKTPMSTDELLPSVSEVREVREDDHCTCSSKLLALMRYFTIVVQVCGVTKSTGLIQEDTFFSFAVHCSVFCDFKYQNICCHF
jgi:hypothetical protein